MEFGNFALISWWFGNFLALPVAEILFQGGDELVVIDFAGGGEDGILGGIMMGPEIFNFIQGKVLQLIFDAG